MVLFGYFMPRLAPLTSGKDMFIADAMMTIKRGIMRNQRLSLRRQNYSEKGVREWVHIYNN